MPDSLLRLPDVIARVGLRRSTIYAMVARGEFPRPVKLSERSVAWSDKELSDWVTDRLANRHRDDR